MYSVSDDPKGRVSPFGNLRIKVCLLTPRSLSQATTSFIACNRQGIRHVHLFTCPYNHEGYKVQAFTTVFDEFYYYPKYESFDSRLIKLYFFQIFKEQELKSSNLNDFIYV
jgi:hypothetical protein